MSEVLLDLKGLKCPLPAMRVAKALQTLPAGTVLVVLATDPLAVLDVPNEARQRGGEIIDIAHHGDVVTFRLQLRAELDGVAG